MASNIDASKPTTSRAFTADVRANFAAAKAEIEALQTSDGISFTQSGSGTNRTVEAKLRDFPSTADYGVTAATTATQNATALTAALAAHDEFIVSSGTYDNFTISSSSKTLHMEDNVSFKVPDDTVENGETSGPAGLLISGSNVTIFGDFTVDGNAANNDSSSFAGDARQGLLEITGDNVRIPGKVHLLNPYYDGLEIDGGNDTGDEVSDTYIGYLKVTNPKHYATYIWTAEDWEIGTIEVIAGANSTDQRIRTGTQNSSTGECLNGKVGRIVTERGVIVEARTNGLYLGSVRAKHCKFEDAFGIRFGSIDIYDAGDSQDIVGFAVIDTDDIQGGDVIVADYDGLNDNAVAITETETCSIKSIIVKGTVPDGTRDMIVRSADGLKIDLIVCKDPVGTGDGIWFDFDAAYTPQKNIRIGALLSAGHTTNDVVLDSGFTRGDVWIQYLNSDAVVSGTTPGPVVHEESGLWTATMVCGTSGTITLNSGSDTGFYTRQGNMVHISGRLLVDSVSSPMGVLTIAGLPYPNTAGGDRSPETAVAVNASAITAGDGIVQGVIVDDAQVITLSIFFNGAATDAAARIQANSIITFQATYRTDAA